ncbi:alpha/beta hydrolase fold domain-containing protein [Caulobacter segnis]
MRATTPTRPTRASRRTRTADLSGLAPAVIATAGFDPLVGQGEAYAKRLKAAGVPVLYRCYDSLAHGFTAFTGAIPAADSACREIAPGWCARRSTRARADARPRRRGPRAPTSPAARSATSPRPRPVPARCWSASTGGQRQLPTC